MSSDPVAFGKALADETRQRIMSLLCCRELCVSDLVAKMRSVSQPTVSHHLQILKTAGLVDTRRDGKQVYYSLRQEAIANCCLVIAREYAPEIDLLDADTSPQTAQAQ
jgi:DNA-binding transcriptional ArsR family regulator